MDPCSARSRTGRVSAAQQAAPRWSSVHCRIARRVLSMWVATASAASASSPSRQDRMIADGTGETDR
jgi:hypothetical protein